MGLYGLVTKDFLTKLTVTRRPLIFLVVEEGVGQLPSKKIPAQQKFRSRETNFTHSKPKVKLHKLKMKKILAQTQDVKKLS